MREDYSEALDKMFPDGYAIAYSCPDKTMRFSHYAPTEEVRVFISRFWELAKEIGTESEPD